jgi:hypothetical protein
MKKLETLLTKAKEADASVNTELMRLFPVGSQLCFTIKHGQRTPSTGRVHGLGGMRGYLRVQHYEAKPNSRYAYRNVHYSDVLR